jgi:hypothetical protein
LALNEAVGADGKSIQRIAHHGKIFAASFGDAQALALAIEEFSLRFSPPTF